MTRIELQVTFDSDWAVGAGRGDPGGADQVVVRDADGLPFVPRTTLRGVLRDAVEQVALALDDGAPGAWSAFSDGLFGRRLTGRTAADRPDLVPQRSRLAVSDLRVSVALRSELMGSAGAWRRQALVAERPAVAIDPVSGTASDRQLRFIEVARSGLVVGGHLDLDDDLDREVVEAAVALLDAGSKLLRSIGSGRRRGLGACRVRLRPPSQVKVRPDQRLRQAPPSIPVSRAARGATAIDRTSGDAEWFRLEFRTLSPLVAAAGTLGNVVQSLDHLPGRALLPVLSEVFAAADADLPGALRRGLVRIGPALPSVPGRSPVPLPACLLGGSAPDERITVLVNATHPKAPALSGPVKGAGGGCLAAGGSGPTLRVRTSRTLSTHNVIDPGSQRPDQLAGGVYSYEAIDAGTTLTATLLLDAGVVAHLDRALPDWRERLGAQRALGAARMAGFGRVDVQFARIRAPRAASVNAEQPFTVLLTGPVACGHGPQAAPPTATELLATVRSALVDAGAAADLQLAPAPGPFGGWQWLRTVRFDGWNARDGLPRNSVIAAAAGSTLRLRATADISAEVIAAAMQAGLGRRREEGFGWFVIDPPELSEPTLTVALHTATNDAAGAGQKAALTNAERTLLGELDRIALAERALSLALQVGRDPQWRRDALGWTGSEPVRSQLGNLRGVLADPTPEALPRWLAQRRADAQRFVAEDREGRWTVALLDRLAAVLANPAAVVGAAAARLGVDANAVPTQPAPAQRFARDLLLVAATAHSRAERQEVSA